MKRSGVADLPLHSGRVPEWLTQRMVRLGTAIVETVVHQYGRPALLSRLSDPFWFQAFGCVLGMDWHSSGITTSVMGALKKGLNPRAHELGSVGEERRIGTARRLHADDREPPRSACGRRRSRRTGAPDQPRARRPHRRR